MRFRIGLLAALAALSGCAYTGPIYFAPPANQFAVSVPAPVQDRVTNYTYAHVSTTLNGRAVNGAACSITSTEVDAGFVSPAYVDLPVYHRPPPPARLTCTHGKHTATRLLHPSKVAEIQGDPEPKSFEMLVSVLSNAVAETLNIWSYVRRGDHIVVELND